jgi:hypothetical protein
LSGEGWRIEGLYLIGTIDVEDTTEAFAVVVDRLIELQVDEELPVYVVIVPPRERFLERLRESEHTAHSIGGK